MSTQAAVFLVQSRVRIGFGSGANVAYTEESQNPREMSTQFQTMDKLMNDIPMNVNT